ncbi:MAG TPA: AAA family ATPase, partial [Actinomycetota bacterium]|nr:AAA family ATPase [Actinomycetota bacterium]
MNRALLTLLFTDLVGSTELFQRLGDEGAGELFRTYFRVLREAVAENHGQEVKTLGDGMMVAFETTEAAFNCAASIQRGLELRNRTGSAPLGVRIGINTGEVIREEGDYFGMAVVLAKRLCDRAQGGQILVSERAHGAGRTTKHVARDLGVLSLKGVADPVRVFELAWQTDAYELIGGRPATKADAGSALPSTAGVPIADVLGASLAGAFLGRAGEVDRLTLVAADADPHRDLVLIAGEPGVGKTRLCAEFARAAAARGVLVLYGHFAEESLVPLQPFSESLSHLFANLADDTLWEQIRSDPSAAELAPFVPELARAIQPSAESPVEDVDTGRFRLFDGVRRLLDLVSVRTPVVLLLDDLQWADKQSLLLLKYLARADERGRLTIVATYRPSDVQAGTPLARTLPDLQRARGFTGIRIDGLSEPDVRTLVHEWAGSDPSAELVRSIARDTHGNPFFIREVLRHLLATGALREHAGRVTSTVGLDEAGVPDGVRRTIERRLASLGEHANEVLSVGSVIGREFDLRTMRRVSALPTDGLLEALDEATAAQIIAEVPGREPAYRFEHALTRETLYSRIPGGTKVRLHSTIGDVIEQMHRDDPESHVTEIADHLLLSAGAADLDRTIDYAMKAGMFTLSRFAFEDSASFFKRGLGLLDETKPSHAGRRCDLLVALAESERRAGETNEARASFHAAAALARQIGSGERLAVAALGYGAVGFGAMWFGEGRSDEELVRLLDEAREALPRSDSGLRARLMTREAQELFWSPKRDRAVVLSNEAVAIARRLGNPGELASALIGHFSVRVGLSTLDERKALVDEALPLAQQAGDGDLALRARAFRVIVHAERGDRDAFDAEVEEYLRHAPDLRQVHHLWYADVLRAAQSMLDGRFDDVDLYAKRALDLGKRGDDRSNALLFFGGQVLTLRMLQGRGGEFEASMKGFEDEYPSLPVWRAALAHHFSEADRREEARKAFDPLAADGFLAVSHDAFAMNALASLSLVCTYLQDAKAAADLYGVMAPFDGRYVWIPPALGSLGPVSFHLGLLSAVLRRLPEAFGHLEDAVEHSAVMRDRPWYVMSQFALAVSLLLRRDTGDVERAYSLLDDARASAEEMGLRSPLDRPLARLFFDLAEERGIREELESVLFDDARGAVDPARAHQPGKIKSALRRRGLKQLSKMVADATDQEIEERFQSRPVQRALFTATALTFVPEKAYGFQGQIAYELTSGPDPSGCIREPDHWIVTITGDKASARRGKASAPAVSVRIGLADFVRVAAGDMNPVKAMLAGRIEV